VRHAEVREGACRGFELVAATGVRDVALDQREIDVLRVDLADRVFVHETPVGHLAVALAHHLDTGLVEHVAALQQDAAKTRLAEVEVVQRREAADLRRARRRQSGDLARKEAVAARRLAAGRLDRDAMGRGRRELLDAHVAGAGGALRDGAQLAIDEHARRRGDRVVPVLDAKAEAERRFGHAEDLGIRDALRHRANVSAEREKVTRNTCQEAARGRKLGPAEGGSA
jgi:hypothetical protein